MKYKPLLPEHIPNGARFSKDDLQPLNQALEKAAKSTPFYWLIPMLVLFALGFLMTQAGGFVGNMLAVVFFIAAIPVSAFSALKPGKKILNMAAALGIDAASWKAAAANRAADARAWGESVSMNVLYRFRCRKCGQDTQWFAHTLTSCTAETMQDKIAGFLHQVVDKSRYFEHKRGAVRYKLVRVCPSCGKKQRRHPPRWWTILLFTAAAFLVGSILASAVPGDPTTIVMSILTVVVFVFSLVWYIAMRKPAGSPQYYIAGHSPEIVPYAQFKSVSLRKPLRYMAIGLNCLAAAALVFTLLEESIGQKNLAAILLAAAVTALYVLSLILLFRRSKLAWVLIGITALSPFLYMLLPDMNMHLKEGLIMALIVLIPALLYLPFFTKKADETENVANL